MKTKKIIGAIVFTFAAISLTSCNKCHECHYEKINDMGEETEVELGEQCGEDLENYEENGIYIAAEDTTYTVHCHEH